MGGNVAGSALQAQTGMEVVIGGGVSKSRFVTTGGDFFADVERDFQGSIQGGIADVGLYVGGSVLAGTTLATGGDAEVEVTRNFNGTVDVDELRFLVGGNVAMGSRIVARRVWEWREEIDTQFHDDLVDGQNFFVGGRFDGILDVGVFDAAPGDGDPVTIIGGGAGSAARFHVGRFETDAIVFMGNFRGNMRILQDLVADLLFGGDVDRITIGGQVLADIVVQGRLLYLISNSYFEPNLPGKQAGRFLNGSFQQTGLLVTQSYVTVLPLSPLPA